MVVSIIRDHGCVLDNVLGNISVNEIPSTSKCRDGALVMGIQTVVLCMKDTSMDIIGKI